MKLFFIALLFSSCLSVMSQNSDIMKSYSNLVTTIKDYSVTSINIKEVDVCYDSRFKGNLVFKNPEFRFDGQNIVFSYVQANKNDHSWVNCIYYETGAYMVSIPVRDLKINVPQKFSHYSFNDNYYIIKVENESGITFCKDNVKELVKDYSFAVSKEMTANKFYNELIELVNLINDNGFSGKLGYNSAKKYNPKKTPANQTGSNNIKSKTANTSQSNNSKSVNNAGNKTTKTIIK